MSLVELPLELGCNIVDRLSLEQIASLAVTSSDLADVVRACVTKLDSRTSAGFPLIGAALLPNLRELNNVYLTARPRDLHLLSDVTAKDVYVLVYLDELEELEYMPVDGDNIVIRAELEDVRDILITWYNTREIKQPLKIWIPPKGIQSQGVVWYDGDSQVWLHTWENRHPRILSLEEVEAGVAHIVLRDGSYLELIESPVGNRLKQEGFIIHNITNVLDPEFQLLLKGLDLGLENPLMTPSEDNRPILEKYPELKDSAWAFYGIIRLALMLNNGVDAYSYPGGLYFDPSNPLTRLFIPLEKEPTYRNIKAPLFEPTLWNLFRLKPIMSIPIYVDAYFEILGGIDEYYDSQGRRHVILPLP